MTGKPVKGPYRVNSCNVIEGPDQKSLGCMFEHNFDNREDARPTALLMASAPEMLEMLSYIADREMLDEDDILAVKGLIAKATGEAS